MLKAIKSFVKAIAFYVDQSVVQSVPNNVWTKLVFNRVNFDTASIFNVVNSRFQPTVPGYYQFNCQVQLQTAATGAIIDFYKNGASTGYSYVSFEPAKYFATGAFSKLFYMNGTTDYIEVFVLQSSGGAVNTTTVITNVTGSIVNPI